MNKESLLWIGFILLVIGITFFGEYRQYEGKIAHDYPATINAADPASRTSDAEIALLDKRLYYEPPWYAIGIPERIQSYAPLMLVLVSSLSSLSGIEIFDLYYFVGVIAMAGIAIGWFLYFRKQWGKPWLAAIAALILSYPLEQFNHYMLRIGEYANFFVAIFIPYLLILFDRMIKEPSWKNIAAFGILAGIQFTTYPTTAVMLVGFLLVYALIAHRSKMNWKKVIIAGLIMVLVAAPYAIVFGQTVFLGKKAAGSFVLFKDPALLRSPSYEPSVDFTNLLTPVLYVLAILGIFVLLKKPSLRLPAILSVFFVFITLVLPALGIGEYYFTTRTRYLLFVFLYPLAAIGIFTAAQAITQFIPQLRHIDKNKVFAVFIAALAVVSIMGVRAISSDGPRMFSKEKYQDFLWVRQNTPNDSVILCFGCQQFEGFVTRRIVLQPMYWDQEKTIQPLLQLAQGNITNESRMLGTEYTGHSTGYPVRTGLFTFKMSGHESYAKRDICIADYFIIMGNPQLGEVFQAIGNRMLAKNSTVIRQSQYMFILKNNNKGGECV